MDGEQDNSDSPTADAAEQFLRNHNKVENGRDEVISHLIMQAKKVIKQVEDLKLRDRDNTELMENDVFFESNGAPHMQLATFPAPEDKIKLTSKGFEAGTISFDYYPKAPNIVKKFFDAEKPVYNVGITYAVDKSKSEDTMFYQDFYYSDDGKWVKAIHDATEYDDEFNEPILNFTTSEEMEPNDIEMAGLSLHAISEKLNKVPPIDAVS